MKKLVARVARHVVPATVAAVAFVASEHKAHALGPVDVEVGAKVGVATNPDSDGVNPFGFGVGARGGVSIFNVYGGLSAMKYFGGSKEVGGLSIESEGSTLLGVEVGYTIKALPLVQIRPQLGVGNAHFASGSDQVDGVDNLYFEPGVTALIPLGLLYVGADVNALLLPGVDAPTLQDPSNSTTFVSLSAHAQVGLTF